MNDPLGVQSAVLGMLSLSQGNYQHPASMVPNSSSVYHQNPEIFQSAESLVKHYSQQQPVETRKTNDIPLVHQQSGLPLTPPGSPDEKKLVISNDSTPPSEVQSCSKGPYPVNSSGFQDIAQAYNHSINGFQQNQTLQPTQNFQLQQSYGSTAGLGELPSTSGTNFSPIVSAASQLFENPMLARALSAPASGGRRSRSEKKPIPVEQKDEKYFERRQRNNQAAKKSRDMRKSREDEIAMRAACLERENAVMRAQVSTLREEAQNMRALILQRRQMQMQMCGPQNLAQQ